MMKKHAQTEAPLNQQGMLGTFSGVFTPSILTILGIILFCDSATWWATPDWEDRW